jgi:hypothetical protein
LSERAIPWRESAGKWQIVMMQFEKSVEELENDYWDKPRCKLYVVTTCFAARKEPISKQDYNKENK